MERAGGVAGVPPVGVLVVKVLFVLIGEIGELGTAVAALNGEIGELGTAASDRTEGGMESKACKQLLICEKSLVVTSTLTSFLEVMYFETSWAQLAYPALNRPA